MSTLEEIKTAVIELPDNERQKFYQWIDELGEAENLKKMSRREDWTNWVIKQSEISIQGNAGIFDSSSNGGILVSSGIVAKRSARACRQKL